MNEKPLSESSEINIKKYTDILAVYQSRYDICIEQDTDSAHRIMKIWKDKKPSPHYFETPIEKYLSCEKLITAEGLHMKIKSLSHGTMIHLEDKWLEMDWDKAKICESCLDYIDDEDFGFSCSNKVTTCNHTNNICKFCLSKMSKDSLRDIRRICEHGIKCFIQGCETILPDEYLSVNEKRHLDKLKSNIKWMDKDNFKCRCGHEFKRCDLIKRTGLKHTYENTDTADLVGKRVSIF